MRPVTHVGRSLEFTEQAAPGPARLTTHTPKSLLGVAPGPQPYPVWRLGLRYRSWGGPSVVLGFFSSKPIIFKENTHTYMGVGESGDPSLLQPRAAQVGWGTHLVCNRRVSAAEAPSW